MNLNSPIYYTLLQNKFVNLGVVFEAFEILVALATTAALRLVPVVYTRGVREK